MGFTQPNNGREHKFWDRSEKGVEGSTLGREAAKKKTEVQSNTTRPGPKI
jgi:hypothetical protein